MEERKRMWSRVEWWRNQGVNAKWGKSHGRPLMLVECNGQFEVLSKQSWQVIEEQLDRGESLKSAVFSAFGLIDIFSLPMRADEAM